MYKVYISSEKRNRTKDAKNMLNNLHPYTVCYPDLKRSLGSVFKTIFSRYHKNGNKFLILPEKKEKELIPQIRDPEGSIFFHT